jgi:hypothetical protein
MRLTPPFISAVPRRSADVYHYYNAHYYTTLQTPGQERAHISPNNRAESCPMGETTEILQEKSTKLTGKLGVLPLASRCGGFYNK